ncbi:MAG TPA: hypothetical protein VMF08_02960 [Candidatus Sulfotelmatobacter sp.]|nr:hypothetical protein [Candidatus Sulfotelmatobacter sp.]
MSEFIVIMGGLSVETRRRRVRTVSGFRNPRYSRFGNLRYDRRQSDE